jgi:hypothetical protein
MTDERVARHRRSIRLRGYDYAAAGAYFVTIAAQGRQLLRILSNFTQDSE